MEKIPANEALVITEIGEPLRGGVNHYQSAIIKWAGLYFLAWRHCRPFSSVIGPDEPWSCDSYWRVYAGPFRTLEEAESKARELGDL